MKAEKTITQIFEESERNNASRPMGNEIESSSNGSLCIDEKEYGGKTNYVQNGSVYIDGKELGGYTSYITYNPIVDIVMAKKGVDGWSYRLFMFILSNYDNPSLSNRYQKPATISVSELASIYNISAQHIHNCLKELIKSNFLILASKGKGKKPSSYIPNVPYIHKLMAEYYKDGKEYFKATEYACIKYS